MRTTIRRRRPSRRRGQVVLWALVALLIAAEVLDDARVLSRRLAHLATSWWARLERRERRHVRHSQLAAVARRIDPRPSPAPDRR
jgi:hypothetical protein